MNADLQRTGQWEGPETVDWPRAIQNLQASLDLAIKSRRGDAERWKISAPLHELVGMDWAITEAGIESRHTNGVIVKEEEFPDSSLLGSRRHLESSVPKNWPPARPEWTDPNEWSVVLERGNRRFPNGRLPVSLMTQLSWIPHTGSEIG